MNYLQNLKIVEMAKFMLNNKSTIRATAKMYGIPKSTLHNYIHSYLPFLDKNLYKNLQELLDENFNQKHIRGGEATKLYYEHLNEEKQNDFHLSL